MNTFRYFPWKGNTYHELRIAKGTSAGNVELVILKDRGNRSESITIRAADVDEICERILAAAGRSSNG